MDLTRKRLERARALGPQNHSFYDGNENKGLVLGVLVLQRGVLTRFGVELLVVSGDARYGRGACLFETP